MSEYADLLLELSVELQDLHGIQVKYKLACDNFAKSFVD